MTVPAIMARAVLADAKLCAAKPSLRREDITAHIMAQHARLSARRAAEPQPEPGTCASVQAAAARRPERALRLIADRIAADATPDELRALIGMLHDRHARMVSATPDQLRKGGGL